MARMCAFIHEAIFTNPSVSFAINLYIGECVCVCVCVLVLSKRIHIAVCGPIGTKFGTHMQIHLEKLMGKIKICPV